jgi:hypothetical protein
LISIQTRDVAFWHFASFYCAAKFGRYWSNNGHGPALTLSGSAAIDPKPTFKAAADETYS